MFDDADIAIPVERTFGDTGVPLPLLIRATNHKTVFEINQEIEASIGRRILDEQDFILSKHQFSTAALTLYYRLPQWVRLLAFKWLFGNPFRAKRNSGTVLMTLVNATGSSGGWILPTRSLHNLSIGLGSVTKKPWVVDGEIKVRDIQRRSGATMLPGSALNLRLLVSCHGFRPEEGPLAYTVSKTSVLGLNPRLFSDLRTSGGLAKDSDHPAVSSFAVKAATELLRVTNLGNSQPIVALDILAEQVVGPKGKSNQANNAKVKIERSRQGDEQLFKAVYGAIKAGMFWRSQGAYGIHGTLNVTIPVCLISKPFWSVCVDGREAATPELHQYGYQVFGFPERESGSFLQPLVLIVCIDSFKSLVQSIQTLEDWFQSMIEYEEIGRLRTLIAGPRMPT